MSLIILMLISTAFFAGCTGAGGRHASGEYYQKVPGAVAWAKRHIHETEHYRIESNCPLETVRRCGQTLETLYTLWSSYIRKPAPGKRMPVQIYASREEFQKALNKPDVVRGLYGDGQVITYCGIWRGSSTRESLFHEGTHQLHDACMGIKKAPIWFAEGLARFFEHFRSDAREKLYPAFDDESIQRTRWDIDESPGKLSALLSTPKDEFDIDCYDRAHLLLYFLVNTTKRNRDIFDSYWRVLLKNGEKPGSGRFIELLGGKEALKTFEKRWLDWVASLHYLDTPETARENALKLEKSESE